MSVTFVPDWRASVLVFDHALEDATDTPTRDPGRRAIARCVAHQASGCMVQSNAQVSKTVSGSWVRRGFKIPPPPLHRETALNSGFSGLFVARPGYGRSQIWRYIELRLAAKPPGGIDS